LPAAIYLSNPAECADYLQQSFRDLEDDLADNNPSRMIEKAYFRKRIANVMLTPAKSMTLKTPKAPDNQEVKVCFNFLGSHLRMKNSKGVVYRCEFGANCKFSHSSTRDKTSKELKTIIDALPFRVQDEFRKAVASKNKK
jgi:hypothetical protein